MSKDAGFDKYGRDGAYHWAEIDPGWRNGRFNPPLVARYQALIDRLPEAPQAILEVGCGDGCLLHRVGRARPEAALFGVEPVAEGVALAQRNLERRGTEARIVAGDAYALPFPDASFEVVLMADVIEHLARPVQALVEAERVLRYGGVLLLSTPHRQPDFAWDSAHHCHEYDGGELSALLTPHFEQVELSACSPMRWLRVWRAHSSLRVALRLLSRCGFDPIARTSPCASPDYGQIIALCAG